MVEVPKQIYENKRHGLGRKLDFNDQEPSSAAIVIEKAEEGFEDRYLDHTGVYNRKALIDLLPELIEVEGFGEKLEVVLVDIKGLGKINSKSGHSAGDKAINATVAALLEAGVVFRLGGDEFVIIRDVEASQGQELEVEPEVRKKAVELAGDDKGLAKRFNSLSIHAGSSYVDKHDLKQRSDLIWDHIKAADPKGHKPKWFGHHVR